MELNRISNQFSECGHCSFKSDLMSIGQDLINDRGTASCSGESGREFRYGGEKDDER